MSQVVAAGTPTFAIGGGEIGLPIACNMDASGHVQDHQHVIGHHGFYAHHGYMMGVYGNQMIMQQHHQIHEGSGQG